MSWSGVWSSMDILATSLTLLPTPSVPSSAPSSPRDPPMQTVPEVQEGAIQEDSVALIGGLSVLPLSLKWERMDTPHDTAKKTSCQHWWESQTLTTPKSPGCGHTKPLTFHCNPCGQRRWVTQPHLSHGAPLPTNQGSFALRSFALAGSFC